QGGSCIAPRRLVRGGCHAGHAGLRSRDADAGRHHRGSSRDRATRLDHAAVSWGQCHRRPLSQPRCRDVRMSIDPITLEIISNGFKSIADETYIALMKSAYSTNIKERHDHSTAIIDPAGRLIVQAENSLAIHLGSMMGLMNTLLAKMPLSDVREGDIFISNDPYVAGGSHLPDVNMAMPVFADGKLVCFMCNIAHHADIGGITPGEYTFEDLMDDDGVSTTNIPIKLCITVPPHGSNRKVLFDFTGSGPQVKGNINSTITATQAGVLYSLKALLDPDVPNNQGL